MDETSARWCLKNNNQGGSKFAGKGSWYYLTQMSFESLSNRNSRIPQYMTGSAMAYDA